MRPLLGPTVRFAAAHVALPGVLLNIAGNGVVGTGTLGG